MAKKLEIAKTEEWRSMLKELERRLKEYYRECVVSKSRTGELFEIAKAIGKHDGYLEAITTLQEFGGG